MAALFSVEHEQLSAVLSDSDLFEAGSSASILAQHPMRLLTNHSDACYCRAQTPVFHVICEPGSPQPTCLGASCAIRARQSSAPALSVFKTIHWAARSSSRHFLAAPQSLFQPPRRVPHSRHLSCPLIDTTSAQPAEASTASSPPRPQSPAPSFADLLESMCATSVGVHEPRGSPGSFSIAPGCAVGHLQCLRL